MNFDFALILVIATLVTGIGWLIDKMIYEKPRTATFSKAQEGMDAELTKEMKEKLDTTPWWSDFSRSMFPVLAIVLIVRSFLVEPFQIPSGSMLPTLKIGDFILVNKYDYGLRLPVLGTKVIPVGEPERGDVVVFKFPNDPSVNYIKRLIGLPGDVITYKDKKIYVNGLFKLKCTEQITGRNLAVPTGWAGVHGRCVWIFRVIKQGNICDHSLNGCQGWIFIHHVLRNPVTFFTTIR
jgi:signal peptidase I